MLCLDNVEQYIKDVRLLVRNESCGHAFAFIVLGQEELAKAYIYHMCSEGLLPKSVIEKIARTRGSHIRKQIIAGTLAFVHTIVHFFQRLAEFAWEQAGDNYNKRLEIVGKKLKETTNDLKRNQDQYKKRMFEFLEELATLEEDKQSGLYVDVDITEGTLSSPKSLERHRVEEHLARLVTLFEFMKPLLVVKLPQSERRRMKTIMKQSGMLKDFLELFDSV